MIRETAVAPPQPGRAIAGAPGEYSDQSVTPRAPRPTTCQPAPRMDVVAGVKRCFLFALLLLATCGAAATAEESDKAGDPSDGDDDSVGWSVDSRLEASQWVGAWLISRDGEARHVWSLRADGTGRAYAFRERDGEKRFAYGYDIHWYFDPFTQMAHIKTERRIVCRDGKVYPYFLTLKSYESDYAVQGKFSWQTTWTEASIGRNRLHKSLVVFLASLSGWHDPRKNAPCPQFPRMSLEKDIDMALDRWEREAQRDRAADTLLAEEKNESE